MCMVLLMNRVRFSGIIKRSDRVAPEHDLR